jgi:hypothetical protein
MSFRDCTQQTTLNATPTTFIDLGGEMSSLTLDNCALGIDGGRASGTLMDLRGQVCKAVLCKNVQFESSAVGVRLSTTAGETAGVMFDSCVFGADTGINLGSATAVTAKSCVFNSTTPWTGTAPTNIDMTGNDYTEKNTHGISLAAGATSAVSRPGSSADGFGTIELTVISPSTAFGRFLLQGPAGTTTLLDNPNTAFGNSAGADDYNVYWNGSDAYILQNNTASTALIRYACRYQ